MISGIYKSKNGQAQAHTKEPLYCVNFQFQCTGSGLTKIWAKFGLRSIGGLEKGNLPCVSTASRDYSSFLNGA